MRQHAITNRARGGWSGFPGTGYPIGIINSPGSVQFDRPAAPAPRNGRYGADPRQWCSIRNEVRGGTAEVYIYDEIGMWGVSAQDFARALADVDADNIDVRLNSPGGDAFDGIAIHNALRNHRAYVKVSVDGLAASAASIIAMAGDEIVMGAGSQMMIHDASGVCVGPAADMYEMAAVLDNLSDNLAAMYADKAGGDVAEWRDRMRAETWYGGAEAVSAGLADSVFTPRQGDGDPEQRVAASLGKDWAVKAFKYRGRGDAPAPDVVLPSARRQEPRREQRPAARAVPVADPVPAEDDAPFEFDPEIFRAVVDSTYANAPAPPQTPAGTPESEAVEDEFILDRTAFINAVTAAVREDT